MKKTEGRGTRRCELVWNLSVFCEGVSGRVPVHLPDISVRGMFINTSQYFPVGTVLKVQFHLWRTDFQVEARAEVRHCVPGVGVGVEFVDLSAEAQRAIEAELAIRPPGE